MARGGIIALLCLCLQAAGAWSDTIRVATFNASLSRNGPGLLLRAIEKGEDAQIANVMAIIQHIRPDILLLNEFDFDVEGRAATAFTQALADGPDGIDYPHMFLSIPNTGRLSGIDLNGDGTASDPQDAFGFGRFPGHYGMVLLSRFPVSNENSRTFAKLLWKDLPGANLPKNQDGSPFPSAQAHSIMRLSSKSHWDVAVRTPAGVLHVLASHPTPPVFDGPEDLNGLRNADEIRFWTLYLNGQSFMDDQGRNAKWTPAPSIVMGDLNADPNDGDGVRPAIRSLVNHPALQDPAPRAKAVGLRGKQA